MVAANSPPGRSSTAQGIFGAAGTVGFIVSSLVAGVLANVNIVYPFYVFSAVLGGSLVIGLLIGGQRLRGRGVVVTSPDGAAASTAHVRTGP
jgi:MFS family permease